MLLQDFVYVGHPAPEVVARLRAKPAEWLSPFAEAADDGGDELRMRVGPGPTRALLRKTVRVVCGEPTQRGGVTIVPITWHAEGMAAAFPELDGELEVADVGGDRCQITLMGRYDPPLGSLGDRMDRLVLHRVAQASVRSFLGRVARALEDALPTAETREGVV